MYKGTYKNLNKPVPVEDLWDMWRKKMSFLRKVHEFNTCKGKKIEGAALVTYDLAIILSKYDGYLKWKEEQTLAKTGTSEEQVNIDYEKMATSKSPKERDKNNDSLDIDSIINEI